MDRIVDRSILKDSKTLGKNLAVVIRRICIIAYGAATTALQLDGIKPKMQDKGDKYCQPTFVKAHQTVHLRLMNFLPINYISMKNLYSVIHNYIKFQTKQNEQFL